MESLYAWYQLAADVALAHGLTESALQNPWNPHES
jgi:hypothetical protein